MIDVYRVFSMCVWAKGGVHIGNTLYMSMVDAVGHSTEGLDGHNVSTITKVMAVVVKNQSLVPLCVWAALIIIFSP